MNEPKPEFTNKSYLLPHINSEGIRFGVIALLFAMLFPIAAIVLFTLTAYHILAMICAFLAIPFLLLAYGVFLFFRDPERYPPNDEKAILSPADGRVCMIKATTLPEELLKDIPADWQLEPQQTYQRVSVFMSVMNVHVNRMPTDAKILRKVHVPGKFFNAALDKASTDNERCAYLLETPAGVKYGVVQIAGLVAKRIVPFVKEGDSLKRVERFGLIRFGSRLDVYLPAGVTPTVREGQVMVAGESILGYLL